MAREKECRDRRRHNISDCAYQILRDDTGSAGHGGHEPDGVGAGLDRRPCFFDAANAAHFEPRDACGRRDQSWRLAFRLLRSSRSPMSLKMLALLEMPFDLRARPPHRLELLACEQRELIGAVW